MVFTVLGAVAELERSLIAERVRAGLRNARAKGKRLGRPRVIADRTKIGRIRAAGLSWAKIAAQLGIGEGTVYREGGFDRRVASTPLRPPELNGHVDCFRFARENEAPNYVGGYQRSGG